MKTLVKSATCNGNRAGVITIESSFTRGYSGIQLLGNTSDVCRDGKERAKAALEKMGLILPNKRLLISFSPADLKKDGNQFDLPVAVSLLLLVQDKPQQVATKDWMFCAELGLSGELKPVKGIIPFVLAALEQKLRGIVTARANLRDVRALARFGLPYLDNFKIHAFDNLGEVATWLFSGEAGQMVKEQEPGAAEAPGIDFDDMLLTPTQELMAATCGAGLHSLLLRGTPGSGKTMLASRLPSIFPLMPAQEHLEALKMQSAYYERIPTPVLRGTPPFRHPHHGASMAAILGNGDTPGELSLAHGGILFLDELPEFRRDLLEALREPLETGMVQISRSQHKSTWKARVILIAACNNCPCGWHGSRKRQCQCNIPKIIAYQHKLSGPLLDRIDIHFNMPEPRRAASDLFTAPTVGQTNRIRTRVEAARQFSSMRNKKLGIAFNRDLTTSQVLVASGLSARRFSELLDKVIPCSASNRAVLRVVRVARTIADLHQAEAIREEDLKQAWQWQEDIEPIMRPDLLATNILPED